MKLKNQNQNQLKTTLKQLYSFLLIKCVQPVETQFLN